jgi:hypothetical protein
MDHSTTKNQRFRPFFGALLGGVYGLILGWGYSGGWDLFYFKEILTTKEIKLVFGVSFTICFIGLVTGSLLSLPERWERACLCAFGIAIVISILSLILFPITILSLAAIAFTAAFAMLFAVFQRILFKLVTLFTSSPIFGMSLAIVIMVLISLALTWIPDQWIERSTNRRRLLRETSQEVLSLGYEVETLEYYPSGSAYDVYATSSTVDVYTRGGNIFRCTVYWDQQPDCTLR